VVAGVELAERVEERVGVREFFGRRTSRGASPNAGSGSLLGVAGAGVPPAHALDSAYIADPLGSSGRVSYRLLG
jgi:hypothetical protein